MEPLNFPEPEYTIMCISECQLTGGERMGRGLHCTVVLWSVARHGPHRTLHDKQNAYNVVGKADAVFFVINQNGPLYTCKDLYDNQCTLEVAAEVTEKLDIIDKWVLLQHITLQGQVTCVCT